MPPVNSNNGRNNRGRPRNNLANGSVIESRRPGRVAGQVVSSWGSRVPNSGDRIEDAQIIHSPKTTWK